MEPRELLARKPKSRREYTNAIQIIARAPTCSIDLIVFLRFEPQTVSPECVQYGVFPLGPNLLLSKSLRALRSAPGSSLPLKLPEIISLDKESARTAIVMEDSGFGFYAREHPPASEERFRRPLGKSKSALSTELGRLCQQQPEADEEANSSPLIR